MKSCETCRQVNPDDARFCQQCGTAFSSVQPTELVSDEAQLWRKFIGPNADRYLETFKKFSTASGPRFAFTWNWPAFLFEPFLWFLYRKMYLYALVYAVGPVVAFYFTQDLSADFVWRIMAGASANYIYYWHIKEQLAKIGSQRSLDVLSRDRILSDSGGVQPYVVWVGVGLFALKVALLIALLQAGPPDHGGSAPSRTQPAPTRTSA
ncbi:MAG: hypothetical protein KatS3mg082_2230 [Nitrospiraceae bacterium]|nr:MAG: hypothetical protein KatS3mg082_2230 [Nitrospiraceae bacterium]